MKAAAPRLLVVVATALLVLLPAGPAPAQAKTRSAGVALGGAQVAKGGQWRRARALRHRRQAAKARAAAKAKASAAENPEILFRGDFDAGFGGWHVQSLTDRASLITGDAFQGSQAARFEVQQGDVEPETGSQRSEVSGPTFEEGEDLYIRDAIRVPGGNTYSAPWQIIEQLHEEDWGSSPGMALFLDNSQVLALGSGDGSEQFWEGPQLQSDRWYDLVYRVNLSQDPSDGFVEVWLDGAPQTLVNGQARIYGQTIQAVRTYLKAGIYRCGSSTGTTIVEHDDIVVGTSYAAVTGS